MYILGCVCVPHGTDSKESTCNVGDLGLIPGKIPWRRAWQPTPVQQSCLENPHGQRDSTVHWVTKSQTRLKAHTRASTHTMKEIYLLLLDYLKVSFRHLVDKFFIVYIL